MRSDQVPTIASFMDFGAAGGAAGFWSAAGGRWAFWAWPETGSIRANVAIATTPSVQRRFQTRFQRRFIVFLPLHLSCAAIVHRLLYAQIEGNFAVFAG